MNSLFFDKWGDKFSTDSSVFSTNVSRVLQGWKEGDNFAAKKESGIYRIYKDSWSLKPETWIKDLKDYKDFWNLSSA